MVDFDDGDPSGGNRPAWRRRIAMTGETSGTTRRRLLASGLFLLARHAVGASNMSSEPASHDNANVDYGRATLPSGIRSRRINTNNQMLLHTLEAGFESPGRPCVVLLHGFPELRSEEHTS